MDDEWWECGRKGCTDRRSLVPSDYYPSQWCDAHRCQVINIGEKTHGRRCLATTNRSDHRCETHASIEAGFLLPMEVFEDA